MTIIWSPNRWKWSYLLLGGVEGEIANIQSVALLQQLLLFITVSLKTHNTIQVSSTFRRLGHWPGSLVRWYDVGACESSDVTTLDNKQYHNIVNKTFNTFIYSRKYVTFVSRIIFLGAPTQNHNTKKTPANVIYKITISLFLKKAHLKGFVFFFLIKGYKQIIDPYKAWAACRHSLWANNTSRFTEIKTIASLYNAQEYVNTYLKMLVSILTYIDVRITSQSA